MINPYRIDIEDPVKPPSSVVIFGGYIREVWDCKKSFSSLRDNYQRTVYVTWEDNNITIEPVCNLIDFVNKEIYYKMIPVLYNWKVEAETGYYKCNCCSFCINFRNNCSYLCSECENNTPWLKELIKCEKMKRDKCDIKYRHEILKRKRNILNEESDVIIRKFLKVSIN